MPTFLIVEHLNVFEDVLRGFGSCGVVPMVHELTLERPEETFDAGVVPAVAFAAHAGDWRGGRIQFRFLALAVWLGVFGLQGECYFLKAWRIMINSDYGCSISH